jgi:hypothetical protein
MIRPTGSEFATNRSGLSGAAGEVRMFRMLHCPVSPIRAANPSTHAGRNHLKTTPSTAIPETHVRISPLPKTSWIIQNPYAEL